MMYYLSFSLSIACISWLVGIIVNSVVSKAPFYKARLYHLNFISNEKVNRLLGLGVFKWLILHSFFKYLNPKLSIHKRISVSELGDYRLEMTKAELNHLFAFAFMAIFIGIKIFQQHYLFAVTMLLVNILMNLFPSLLQQQNKRRIDQYLHILKQRSS